MTVIHGSISKVLEILKIAYTEKGNIKQNGWIHIISYSHPPGYTGWVLAQTPSGETAILKRIQVTCYNAATLMWVELYNQVDGTLILGSYFIENHKWDLNDTIIPAGHNLVLGITNNTVGNVTFTIQLFMVDAVGILT